MTQPSKHPLPEALELLDAQVTPMRKAEQRRRLLLAVARHSKERPWRWSVVGLIGVSAAMLLVLLAHRGAPSPRKQLASPSLQATAPAAQIPSETPVEAPETEAGQAKLPSPTPDALESRQLGSGLRVAVRQGSRITGRRLSRSRVQVSLEDGLLEVGPASHRAARASWVVLAGQYRLEARGAQFRVDYAAHDRALQVFVTEGKVRVLGPAGHIEEVTSGQSFRGNARLVRAGSGRSAGRDMHPADWRDLYRRGQYAQAFSRAKEQGHESGQGLEADALMDLADAARLSRARGDAIALLSKLRAQYSGSDRAHDAAFLLGRLTSEQASDASKARAWFQTYLREAPRGNYAQEAMGRLLTLSQAGTDPAAVRELAQRYLTQFPGGPYSALARSLSR